MVLSFVSFKLVTDRPGVVNVTETMASALLQFALL